MRFVKSLSAFALFALFSVLSLSAQATKTSLQNMYMDFLKGEGYVPSIRVLYPNFWEIESEEELVRAYAAAADTSRTTKIAKMFVTQNEDDVSIVAESLLNAPADFKNYFRRLLNTIAAAKRDFIDRMNSN
jgi:hypothetical protein